MSISQDKMSELLVTVKDSLYALQRETKREIERMVTDEIEDALNRALGNVAEEIADSVASEVEEKISDMLDGINDAVSNAIVPQVVSQAQGKVRYEEHQTIISHDTFHSDLQNAGVMIDLILFATQPDCSMQESVRRMDMLRQLANRLKYHTFN